MPKHILAALAAGMLLVTPAIAQDKKAPAAKVAQAPTAAQCDGGYKANMPWTKQKFTAECAKVKAKSQGK